MVLELFLFFEELFDARVDLFDNADIGVDVRNPFGDEADHCLLCDLVDERVLVFDDLLNLRMFVGLEDDIFELDS